MTTATIRRAIPEDAAALAALGAETFTETFGHLDPPEDLQTFLRASHSVEAWNRVLPEPRRAVWIAELHSPVFPKLQWPQPTVPASVTSPPAGALLPVSASLPPL